MNTPREHFDLFMSGPKDMDGTTWIGQMFADSLLIMETMEKRIEELEKRVAELS